MAMIKVNGTTLPTPSEFTWGLKDISNKDSGRTEDALMWKNRVAQKRTLNCGWANVSPSAAQQILSAVNPEYFDVTYYDPLDGGEATRTFYVGDRSAPVKWWHGANGRIYSKISFNLIER